MDSLAHRPRHQTFRVRAPLKIVYARLLWVMRVLGEGGDIAYSPDGGLNEEGMSATIRTRLTALNVRLDKWLVRWEAGFPNEAWWERLREEDDFNLSCLVDLNRNLLTPGIVTVVENEEEEEAKLSPESERRLFDQIRQEVTPLLPEFRRQLGEYKGELVHIALQAIRSEETGVFFTWTERMDWLSQDVFRWMSELWTECAVALPTGLTLRRGYPTDPNDERLLDAGLDEIERFIVSEVNQNNPPRLIQHKLGERYQTMPRRGGIFDDLKALNNRISELRKKHPDLVRPANQTRKGDQERGAKA